LFSEDIDQLRKFYRQLPLGVTIEDYSAVKPGVDKLLADGVKNLGKYLNENPDILFDLVRVIQVTDANDAMLKVFGAGSFQEYLDLGDDVEHWRDATEWREFYAQELASFAAGEVHFGDYQDVTADGTPIISRCVAWVPSGFEDDWSVAITTHEDITERRQTEQNLLIRDTWMNAIFENAPIEIALKDRDGRIIDISSSVANSLGFERKDFIGRTTADFLPGDVAKIYMDADHQVIETGKLVQQEVVEDMDGDPRHLLSAKFPVVGQDGLISGVCSMTTDITEIRQTDAALRQALSDAKQANNAKSTFLANMSHELRTPLNAIQGFSQVMTRRVFGELGSTKYEEYAKDIQDSSEHLLNLINDLLDLSAIEAGKHSLAKECLDVEEVINSCTPIIAAAATEKDIEYIVELPSTPRTIIADRRALKQIFLNILSNAIKFTPRNGRVVFRTTVSNGDHVFQIEDTGEGIPADKLSRVTTPFSRIEMEPHKTQEGTGLGLSIVKSLVELHDGELGIESIADKGTTVRVVLPSGTA